MSDLPPNPLTPAHSRAPYLGIALAVLVTLIAFFPALQAGFIDWDEDPLLIKNFSYRGLGLTQLRWMFTTSRMGHYMPLTWISYGWDYVVWGMKPFGYHLTNLLLHAASAAVFYFIARRLLSTAFAQDASDRSRWRSVGALTAAVLWAVHPLRVESVAWVTERRDVLSGLFTLLAVLAYLGYCAREPRGSGRRRLYGLSLGCFALALLSKAIAATLPAVLLLLDVHPLRRRALGWRRLVLEKVPFVGLGLAAVVVGLWALIRGGGMTPVSQLGWAERIAISLYALGFYLWKTAWPVGLSPLYELPVPLDPRAWPFLVSGAVVVAITMLALALRRRWPALLAVWAAYIVMLLPVVGLAHNGYQIAADRYTYLPGLALALLAGGVVARAGGALSDQRYRMLPAVFAGVVVAWLGTATWGQSVLWQDGVTLWQHALARDPASGIAHANLGGELIHKGRITEAVREFEEAITLRPNYPDAHLFLGVLLAQRGDVAAANAEFRRALDLRPGLADAHNNLGVSLARAGRLGEALEHFRRAVSLDPDSADVRNNLGLALAQLSRLAEAEAQFESAVRLRPGFREAQSNLEQARRLQGK